MRPIILAAGLGLLSAGVHAKVTIDGRDLPAFFGRRIS